MFFYFSLSCYKTDAVIYCDFVWKIPESALRMRIFYLPYFTNFDLSAFILFLNIFFFVVHSSVQFYGCLNNLPSIFGIIISVYLRVRGFRFCIECIFFLNFRYVCTERDKCSWRLRLRKMLLYFEGILHHVLNVTKDIHFKLFNTIRGFSFAPPKLCLHL